MGTAFIQDLAVVMLVAGLVGVLCQRLHLSPVVGFLLAGVVIGPYTPPFQLVTDLDRVQMLADLGLVFLIFAIGLELNLKRIQRLGASLALATFLAAILVLSLGRLLGLALGLGPSGSLFLAAMLMVSSSAIIGKVIEELDLGHERSAQLALGVTVLEDTVAVVMLTLLTSVVKLGSADVGQVLPTLAALGAFVLLLFLGALYLVPRLLTRLDRSSSPEVRNLVLLGIVLALSWLAVRVGYSLALGAFVLGAIVGSTRQKREVERAVEGLRHMFGAVFFVAMGMLLDVKLLLAALPTVLLVSAFSTLVRVAATSVGLISIGNTLRDSLRAGLVLTPIGEFSFIIAQLGVSSGAVPASFFPTAVGVSLVTAFAGPILTRRSDALAARLEALTPRFLQSWVRFYHDAIIERLARPTRSPRSKESLAHLVPAAVQVAFVSAVLLFVEPVYRAVAAELGEDWPFPGGLTVLAGLTTAAVVFPPALAAWGHLSAFGALVVGRRLTLDPNEAPGVLELAIRAVTGLFLAAWLLALLPFGFSPALSVALLGVALLGLIFGLWRPVARLHIRVETQVLDQLHAAQSPPSAVNLARALKDRPEDWALRLEEVQVPDVAPYAGKTIGQLEIRPRFGCSVVGIDRSGFSILNPSREEALYPGDRLLLLGTPEQLDLAAAFFVAAGPLQAEGLDDLTVEAHRLGAAGELLDRPLLELDLIRRFGVQIGGIRRAGEQLPPATGSTRLLPGDEVLLVGTPAAIRVFLAAAGGA